MKTREEFYDVLGTKLKERGMSVVTHDILRTFCSGFFDAVSECVTKDDGVAFNGFGKFIKTETKARKGHNVHTGEVIEIPARNVVKFQPSDVLRNKVAES